MNRKQFTYWDFLGLISVVFIIEMYAIELIIKINNIAKIFMMVFIMYGVMYLIGIVSQTGYELDKEK